jgi:hypothetical protein
MPAGAIIGIGRSQFEPGRLLIFHLVDDALVRVDERRQFREQEAADRGEIALALQHVGEFGQVGLEPILLGIAVGGKPQVVDHRIDVVFQFGHFAARIHLNRAGQVALGHRGRHFGDGAHLRREVGGKEVDVAGEMLPGAGRARHVGLTAEAAVHADLARHGRDLIGEGRERIGHVVDGLGQRRHFALRFHREILLEVAVGDRGHDLHDAAHLLGEIGGHDVDGIGEVFPGAGDAGHLRLAAE